MKLRDTKAGDKIIIYCNGHDPLSLSLSIVEKGHDVKINALVLENNGPYGVVIGWKINEPHPVTASYYDVEIKEAWKQDGIVFAQAYNEACTCQMASNNTSSKNYTNECPCGIHPSRCDYHRP